MDLASLDFPTHQKFQPKDFTQKGNIYDLKSTPEVYGGVGNFLINANLSSRPNNSKLVEKEIIAIEKIKAPNPPTKEAQERVIESPSEGIQDSKLSKTDLAPSPPKKPKTQEKEPRTILG